jgi:hypothetical protein
LDSHVEKHQEIQIVSIEENIDYLAELYGMYIFMSKQIIDDMCEIGSFYS